MRIGILGSGHIGSTVGRLWCEAGHEVRFGTPHPEKAAEVAAAIGANASAGTPDDAARFGEVVLLAVPLKAVPEIADTVGSALDGKVVLDACNPYPERDGDAAREAIEQGHGSSVWTAVHLPGARIVKAFNMQRYDALAAEAGKGDDDPLAIAIASDDEDAIAVAAQLVEDAGFEAVVIGPLEEGRAFDPGTPHYANGVHASELLRELHVGAAR
jgi:predicted dinucleotide-binding enzyme